MLRIHTDTETGKLTNFWNCIHFHPTDAIEDPWGQRILDAVAADGAAHTVRMYSMMEDIVSRDETGALCYDFTLNDTRMDYMLKKGFRLLVSYNFIPPCIAADTSLKSNVSKNKTRYKGKMICTSVPTDYSLWEEICYRYTAHIVERYGLETVKTWYLQCYNEPDIRAFFMGDLPDGAEYVPDRLREYLQLYRAFARGISRVSTELRISQSLAYREEFLRGFLETAKAEALKLDFVCIHNYGTDPTSLLRGTGRLRPKNNIEKQQRYERLIHEIFPGIEVVTDEWGASSGGFVNCETCPPLRFREDSRFAAYFGKMVTGFLDAGLSPSALIICLSGQHEMTTDFSGFRNLFTLHFIKKPIYNAYLLLAKLFSRRLSADCDRAGLDILATADDAGNVRVLLSYGAEDFDESLPPLSDSLALCGVSGLRHVRVFRIDETHTNPCTLAERLGIGDQPTEEEIALLREEGELKPEAEYDALPAADGTLTVPFACSDHALLLIEAMISA